MTIVQRRPNVFDVGPTLYKCYANVLCLLGTFRPPKFLEAVCHFTASLMKFNVRCLFGLYYLPPSIYTTYIIPGVVEILVPLVSFLFLFVNDMSEQCKPAASARFSNVTVNKLVIMINDAFLTTFCFVTCF